MTSVGTNCWQINVLCAAVRGLSQTYEGTTEVKGSTVGTQAWEGLRPVVSQSIRKPRRLWCLGC